MGNIPTLEEVKEYFKSADKVQDHKKDKGFVELEKIEYSAGCFIQNAFKDNWVVLFHDIKGYAKILTHKEPIYKITKEQVLELADLGYENKLKKWFPDVFEKELVDRKWYKDIEMFNIFTFLETKESGRYGFDSHGFYKTHDKNTGMNVERWKEATEQEVFEALKNEAVKRGFKEDVYILSPKNKHKYKIIENIFYYGLENNILSIGGYNIFNNGIWAEILETISKKEAEEKLNCKII